MTDNLSLQVLSWNVHAIPLAFNKAERLERAARRILEEKPDAALLQEVWGREDARRVMRSLESAYRAVDVPQNGLFLRRSGLLTFVRREGWAVRASSFHEFEAVGSAWWKPWEGDSYSGKGYQRIDLERGGVGIALINTHLQAEYGVEDRSRYVAVRASQLEELRRFVESVPLALPVIAAGDLNTRPSEYPYASLVEFWRDLGEEYRRGCRCGTHFLDNGREGDWNVEVTAFERIESTSLDVPFSDHHGLVASLVLARRERAALALVLASPALMIASLTRRECMLALAAPFFSARG
jgi:endonuclease/exonuclease/phosphatase family metal-dependent hydrolase